MFSKRDQFKRSKGNPGITKEDIEELHYILPIANLPSVLARGLLSHRKIEKLDLD